MSIVGRGLGRKAADPALLVTAGLGRGAQQQTLTGGADDAPRRRTDFELSDDELIEIAVALITSGALDG